MQITKSLQLIVVAPALCRSVRGLNKDLSIQHLVLGYCKGGVAFNVITELLMCMAIGDIEPRQKLGIISLQV